MSARVVTLYGGSPWGFRMHGGHDLHQPLRISRVNPGSKAAQQGVREGDLISSIDGRSTRDLTNSEAHGLLRNAGDHLTLGLNQENVGSPKRRIYKSSLQENTSTETLKRTTTKTTSSNSRIISTEPKTNGTDDTRNGKSYVNQNGGLKNTSVVQTNGDSKGREWCDSLDYATDAEDTFTNMPHGSRNRKNRRNKNRKRFQPPQTGKDTAENGELPENSTNEHNETVTNTFQDGKSDAIPDDSNVVETRVNGGSVVNATTDNADSEKDDVVYENVNWTKRKPRNRYKIEKKAVNTETRICEITTICNLPCEAKIDHIAGVGILETGLNKGDEPTGTVMEPIEPLSNTLTSKVKTLGGQNFALALLAKNNSLDIHEVSDSDVEPDNSRVVVVEAESDIEKEPVGELVVLERDPEEEKVEEHGTLEKYYEKLQTNSSLSEKSSVRAEKELTKEEKESLKPEPPMSREVEEKLRSFIEGLKLPSSPEEARDECQKAEEERNKSESLASRKAKKRIILESYFTQTQAANRFLDIIQEEGEKLSEDDEQHIRDFINEEISKYRREERKLREEGSSDETWKGDVRIGAKSERTESASAGDNCEAREIHHDESGRTAYRRVTDLHEETESKIMEVTASLKELPDLEDVKKQNSNTKEKTARSGVNRESKATGPHQGDNAPLENHFDSAQNHVDESVGESRRPPPPPQRSSSFGSDSEPHRPPTPPEIDYPTDLPVIPPLPYHHVNIVPKIPPPPPMRRKSVHFVDTARGHELPQRPPPPNQNNPKPENESESIYENVVDVAGKIPNLQATPKLRTPPPPPPPSPPVERVHKVRVCESNVRSEQNTVDFIKTLLTVLSQRDTTCQDVQNILMGFDLNQLPANIREIIDDLMTPSSRASTESDSAELRNIEITSAKLGNDATPEIAHERVNKPAQKSENFTRSVTTCANNVTAQRRVCHKKSVEKRCETKELKSEVRSRTESSNSVRINHGQNERLSQEVKHSTQIVSDDDKRSVNQSGEENGEKSAGYDAKITDGFNDTNESDYNCKREQNTKGGHTSQLRVKNNQTEVASNERGREETAGERCVSAARVNSLSASANPSETPQGVSEKTGNKFEEAECTTNALSPTDFQGHDSSSSTASLSTAKYNPKSSSLADITSVLHEEEEEGVKESAGPGRESPQPKRKLNLLNDSHSAKESPEDQDSPQPIPYSPIEDLYYVPLDKREEISKDVPVERDEKYIDSKPDLLKDLCIRKILSMPYGMKIINEITPPKFNIFKNIQTIQESVNTTVRPNSDSLNPHGVKREARANNQTRTVAKNSDSETTVSERDNPRGAVQERIHKVSHSESSSTFEESSREEMQRRRPHTWMGVPTADDPRLLVCLSPSQQEGKFEASADNLLDLHRKFLERRGYHEPQRHDPSVHKYRVEVRGPNESGGDIDAPGVGGRSGRWSGDWHIPVPGNRLLEIIKENPVASPKPLSESSRTKNKIVDRNKDAIYNYYNVKTNMSSTLPRSMTRVPSLDENQDRLKATRLSDWLNLARRNSVDSSSTSNMSGSDLLIEKSNRSKYESTDKSHSVTLPRASGVHRVNDSIVRRDAVGEASPNVSRNASTKNEYTNSVTEEVVEKTSEVYESTELSTAAKKFGEPSHYINSALIDRSRDAPDAPVRSVTPFRKSPISFSSAIIDKSQHAREAERKTPVPKKSDVRHIVNPALINDKPDVPPKIKRSVSVDRSCIDTTSIFDKTPPRSHLEPRKYQGVKQVTATEIMDNLKQLQSDMKHHLDGRRRLSLPQEYFDKQMIYIEQLESQLRNVIIAEEEERKAFDDIVEQMKHPQPRPHTVIGGPSFSNDNPHFVDQSQSGGNLNEKSRDSWKSEGGSNDNDGYTHKDSWHEESRNVTDNESELVKKDGYHEESKHVSSGNGFTREESKRCERKEEKYIISKRGDIAHRVEPVDKDSRTERSKSTASAVPTNGEVFRQRMYDEYIHKVQEREERKHHKLIKISSHADLHKYDDGEANMNKIEREFIERAKNRLDKFGINLDESESEVDAPKGETDKGVDAKCVMDGREVIDARTLPKHLQEFLKLSVEPEDEDNMFAPSFKATAAKPGVWSPGSEHPPPPKQPSPDRGKESDKDAAGIPPVWIPTSAGASPVPERKEFRPIAFDSPVLSRKNKPQSQTSTEGASPPWEGEAQKKEASHVVSETITSRIVNSHSAPTQGLNTLAGAPRLPRAQNPTITLLQKAREGQLPKGAAYLEESNNGLPGKSGDQPIISPGEIIYTVKKEYESEPETEHKPPKKMADLGPRKFEGIGPITKEGIPLVLRSEVKENNQAKWYKKMYDSLHRADKDEDYITIRYKPRRGARYGYGSASGYLSEPEPRGYSDRSSTLDSRRRLRNKENDFSTSTMPRKNPPAKYPTDVYRNQPGRIEDYEPGRSSIADKETKEWWDEVMDIFDGWLDENGRPQGCDAAELIQQRRISQSAQALSLSYRPDRQDNRHSVRLPHTTTKCPKLITRLQRIEPEDGARFARPVIQTGVVHGRHYPHSESICPLSALSKPNDSQPVFSLDAETRSDVPKFYTLKTERSASSKTARRPAYMNRCYVRPDMNEPITPPKTDRISPDRIIKPIRDSYGMPEGKSKSFVLPDRYPKRVIAKPDTQSARLTRTESHSDCSFVPLPNSRYHHHHHHHHHHHRISPCSSSSTAHIIPPSAKTATPPRPFEQHSTHTARPYMSHALKESGYESDSTLVFRRREDQNPLSPLEQRIAYKTVQSGGDVPLHGLRKPAPERPKDDSEIEYFPISPTLTRIRVHKKNITPAKELFSRPITSIPSPPTMVFAQYKRSAPSLAASPLRPPSCRAHTQTIFGRSHSTPSRTSSPPPGRPPSRVTSPISRPPSPPRRRSSRNNSTLRLYSKMQITDDLQLSNRRHKQCFTADNVSNIRFLRDRLSCKLDKHRRDREEAQKLRITRTLSTSPVCSRTRVSSTVTADFPTRRTETCHSRSFSETTATKTSTASPERLKTRTATSSSPVSRTPKDSPQRIAGMKRPLEEKPPIKRVSSKSPMSAGSRESTIDRLYSPERTCHHSSRPRTTPTTIRKEQIKPRRTKKEQDEACKRLSRSPDLASPLEVRKIMQRQKDKETRDMQTKVLPSGTVVKSSTTLYSSARNNKQNTAEDKSLKVTVAISSKGRELLRRTTETSTSTRNIVPKPSSLTSSPLTSRKTTFAEPIEDPKIKTSKQQEKLRSYESRESLRSMSPHCTDVINDGNKRKRQREKPHVIVKSPVRNPETVCINPENNDKKGEKRKTRKDKNGESSKCKKSSNGKRSDSEKKKNKKALGKASGSEVAKELKKLGMEPRPPSLTMDEIKRHQEAMKSDAFFQNLFLRNISSPTPSQASVLRTTSVMERARIFQDRNSDNFRSEPSLRSLNIYLANKRPVSDSKFKNWERESISSRCSSPYGVSWPGRSVFQKISKFDSLLSIDDYAAEFGSVTSFRGRSPDITRDCYKERSLSEPPLKVLSENEGKRDPEPVPPRPASPSPIRSPACRRIKSLRQQDHPGTTIVRKARARSAGEVEQQKKIISGSNLSLYKSTSSLNLSQIDREEYQQYVLEMLHCKRKSARYKDLHDFYASLERMGQLERTTSSGDLRPRLKNEEIIDYDRWKDVRSKERAEQELKVLYGKLRTAQKEKDFLFRPKEVDQFRWRGDSGLRCKEKSVENIREQFQKLENEESELESSRQREIASRKDVYKPLWRGNSVVSVANTITKKAITSEAELSARPVMPKSLGVSKKLWSSLSIEQVNALKNQLNEIYSNDNGKPKPMSKSDYEIVVPSQEEFGDNIQEDQKSLHVRCHSLVTPDICKIGKNTDCKSDNSHMDSPFKRSGSISRGRSVERSQSDRAVAVPAMTELEKKRLSLTLSKELLDKVTQKKSSSPVIPRETRGAIAAAAAKPKVSTPSFTDTSPRTCYSLEMSEEGANKQKDKSDFLLVLTPNDETPTGKRRVATVLEQWSKKPPEIAMAVSEESIVKMSRTTSASELDSTTESSETSVRTVIRQDSAEDVPRKVEFYENIENGGAGNKLCENPKTVPQVPDKPQASKLSFSQSFADLKELFGETESARYAALPLYRSRPQSTSPMRSPPASPDTFNTRHIYSHSHDREHGRPRSVSPYRVISNSSSLESIWQRDVSPDPEKYWRAYLKLVKSGAVKRLRAKFESLEELSGGRIKIVPTPKRFQSDPELTRNLLSKGVDRVVVKGQEIADVSWLRRKYEPVRGRARRRGTSPPIQRVPLRMEDLGMPRINVISKLAELKERRPLSSPKKVETKELEAKRAVCRIRKKFEQEKEMSILGEMFTSAPNVHELRDIAPYLAGQWVAHKYPSRHDNARSLSSPELEKPSSSQITRKAPERKVERPRATSSSPLRPRRPPSILKQPTSYTTDIFANQPFDPSKHRPRYRYQPPPPKIHRETRPWWPPIPTYTARPTVTFEGPASI